MEIAANADLRIRTMEDTEQDYALVLRWLKNPDVRQWYKSREGLTIASIRKNYKPRITGQSYVHPTIIEWKQNPVGYLQFYETCKEKEYPLKEPILEAPHVWAMDILIGEADHLDKGIGSGALRLMLHYLFEERGAHKIIIDPDVHNARAIRAYEKAGFQKLKILNHWEQRGELWTDAWLMVCDRMPDAA